MHEKKTKRKNHSGHDSNYNVNMRSIAQRAAWFGILGIKEPMSAPNMARFADSNCIHKTRPMAGFLMLVFQPILTI